METNLLMGNIVKIIDRDTLATLHTGTLMSRRAALLSCEESLQASDQPQDHRTEPAMIEFKSDPLWQAAYTDLKEILATREHWPDRKERQRARARKKGA